MSQDDIKLVNSIIDAKKDKFAHVIFVVSSCDKGVGEVGKKRNRSYQEKHSVPEFHCIMFELHHALITDLSQSEFTSHWMSLNATLLEIGDEFHLLTEPVMKGGTM